MQARNLVPMHGGESAGDAAALDAALGGLMADVFRPAGTPLQQRREPADERVAQQDAAETELRETLAAVGGETVQRMARAVRPRLRLVR